MNLTARMAALLREMSSQRNGVVADAMCFYGATYGLNYGVSLPTVRKIAREVGQDHDFAQFLCRQQVRELRLAALHIADPERIAEHDFEDWAVLLVNSELAEEAAFALLWRTDRFEELFLRWVMAKNPLHQYAVLLAASRSPRLSSEWIAPALAAVHRRDGAATLDKGYAARLVAKAAVAMLAALGAQNEENRQTVLRAIDSLGATPSEEYLHEELAWRLEA